MVDPVPQLEDLELPRGTRVLLRNDFNVPLRDGEIDDDLRITTALPTIEYLREQEARVVCCSHLGRPKGKRDERYTLAPVARRLSELLGTLVELSPDVVGFAAEEMAASLSPGGVMLLENLRFMKGEEQDSPGFATNLSSLGDAYINDAFGASHRAHASIIGPPLGLPSAAGPGTTRPSCAAYSESDDSAAPMAATHTDLTFTNSRIPWRASSRP